MGYNLDWLAVYSEDFGGEFALQLRLVRALKGTDGRCRSGRYLTWGMASPGRPLGWSKGRCCDGRLFCTANHGIGCKQPDDASPRVAL